MPFPVSSLRFWRAYLVTMRPYLLFVSGAAGAVGLAFIPEPVYWRVVLAFFPLFLSYGLGQALTDCFQTDTDSISSPYRPLVRGDVSRRSVMVVSLIGLGIGAVIVGGLNRFALVLAALTVVGLLSYTFFKRRWWGGPAWNSWIVALLPVIGLHAGLGYSHLFPRTETGWQPPLPFALAVLAVFFGYANFVVMGYFKDISADRQTGYRTFPVVFGWTANAVLSDTLAGLLAGLSGVAIWLVIRPGGDSPLRVQSLAGLAVYLAGLMVSFLAQVGIHRTRDEHKSGGPIANVVRAFILFSLALVLALKPGWLVPAAVFYGLFELVLRVRPEQSQV
ncbi:hypothetical protein FJY69_03460 [candidate division WOR-3 bacterium]|nr:hypothetical protein [candidate division WOR-3 bacterium]